ncbi:protein kinase domain-containing protein (plasmid) [Mycolicibacterium aichiense]|uniref:protein kinase domain-containing protein n=1 Tax=Mycolicibacterium aichiense TaxID=1799 RepID=UPI003D6710E6
MVEVLGTGAEARVWRCTHGGREVAVKVYFRAPQYAFEFNSADYLAHFSREWTVEVFQRGCDQVAGTEMYYEVMEYCRHGTLEEFIASSARSDDLATTILKRLAWCIQSLQGPRAKVVHGDIKPRNILIRSRESLDLVLADFGLTVDLQERSYLSNFGQGTTAYNAPEIMRVKGAAADWWSLGMVMYTVLVGRGYYQVGTDYWLDQRSIETDLISHDISLAEIDNVDFPEHRRHRWKLLLAGLLTRDPDQRWGATHIESWLRDESPAVHRPLVTQDSPAGAAQRSAEPFPFAGIGEFAAPTELGAAMAANPKEAARMLSGKGTERLVSWLTDDVRTGDDYSELRQHNWDPDAKVTYFVAKLAPSAALTFRSQPVASPADLRRLVQDGTPDTVDALFTAELLGSVATDAVRSNFRMIDANWHDLVVQAVDAARERGSR